MPVRLDACAQEQEWGRSRVEGEGEGEEEGCVVLRGGETLVPAVFNPQ